MYYNALVPWRARETIKYGVISIRDLLQDLGEWRDFYVSGRLQKPVQIILDDPEVSAANRKNVENAATAALLTLPEEFSESGFYEAVASLSYIGDIRILFHAEDPNKIKKMVSANLESFRELYSPVLAEMRDQRIIGGGNRDRWKQTFSISARARLIQRLPGTLVSNMRMFETRTHGASTQSGQNICMDPLRCHEALRWSLRKIVFRSSTAQAMKGLLSAGVLRSTAYVLRKMSKRRAVF